MNEALAAVPATQAAQKGESTYAVRNLASVAPEVAALAQSGTVRALVEPVLGPGAFIVRSLLFDKPSGANWKVPWHQDLTIAVRERREAPGYGPWSVKARVPHVQPPVEVLEGMLAVRLHLDDCGPDNGPLQVLPGSHAQGRLGPAEIRQWRERVPAVMCAVDRGGALLMRPLLLHASAPSRNPGHRRVIHLEFAAADLPHGLDWWEQRGAAIGQSGYQAIGAGIGCGCGIG